MGKTSLVLNMAQHVGTKTDMTVGIFSLEMSKEQLFLRMLTAEARIDAHRLRGGFLGERDWGKLSQAIGTLSEAEDLHRRHAVDRRARNAREVPAAAGRARPAPGDHRLHAADAGARPLREPHARSGVDLAVAQGPREGAERADRRAVAAQSRARVAVRPSAAAVGPARVGRPRAGRRRRHLHLPRGSVRGQERAADRDGRASPS